MATIPQGFLDQVNQVFELKVTAEASAAFLAEAQATLANSQNAFNAAGVQADSDAKALATGRQALEALEETYFTVGGTIPAPIVTPVVDPASAAAISAAIKNVSTLQKQGA